MYSILDKIQHSKASQGLHSSRHQSAGARLQQPSLVRVLQDSATLPASSFHIKHVRCQQAFAAWYGANVHSLTCGWHVSNCTFRICCTTCLSEPSPRTRQSPRKAVLCQIHRRQLQQHMRRIISIEAVCISCSTLCTTTTVAEYLER